MSTTVTTVTLSDEVVQAAALVGRIATYRDRQVKIHSIEGADYYAFQSDVQSITVDSDMTPCPWITQPRAHLVTTYGDNVGVAPVASLRLGVCLVKTWV